MQNQVDQVESQSNFSLLYECHGKSAPEGSKGSLYFGENCLEQKLLGENNDELCNARTTQSDLSDCMADEPTPRLRNVVNADENACLHGQQESCEAEENLKQKSSTLQDLYAQEYYDDEDDDDSDWEPASHFVIKKWFCANCTMPNFDDVCHCDVCGEHRESDFFRYDLSQLHVGGEVVNSYKGADSSTETCTAIGFDERMLLHSEVEMKSHPHPERPDRLRAIAASLAAAGIFPGKCTFIPPREITQEALLMYGASLLFYLSQTLGHHPPRFEVQTQSTPWIISKQFNKREICFPDTYANEHSACAARLAAGLCADLARTIMSGHARNGFALVRPPGHHAGIKQAMGFCLHNNAAIAALAAQSAGAKKVLIVDWDVHHGNGTQEIFDGNKSVLYVSLHRHEGGRFYPGTGAAYEVGMVDAKGYSVNIPWSCGGVGDNDYIFAFQHVVLPIALEFAPDITIISAGFDAARGDPLGCCDVTPAGYAQMTHMLTGLSQGKLLVILEGGYNLRSISSSATAVVKVLLGEDPGYDMSNVVPSKRSLYTILQVLKIQLKYWPSLKPSYTALQSQWGLVSPNNNEEAAAFSWSIMVEMGK
ncbi:histone deacetylase 15 isoform X3 [Elaeis guineensis]|uniref:histone deacetylase n=1 Tax=Elaeis guineensis var. tenera TaxID=51953 RepID=A0A6I9Q9A9_ELAGV|nr:histone deacetylase 15 isoform X3 [Elaeis guineensis]